MMKLQRDWKNIKHIILYGFGTIGKGCLRGIRKDFIIDFIIDQDVKKRQYSVGDISIYSMEEGLNKRANQKIIVMTGGRIYSEIKEQLEKVRLKEFVDFCSIEYFVTNWYWEYRELNCIMELHMAITMKCTLKCKNCNMFVPYYKNPITYNLKEIQDDLKLLFENVDYVFSFTLLGGEPFLHPEWIEIVRFLSEKYSEKVGTIKIITNGTIIPSDNILEQLKQYPVWINISDYTSQVNYRTALSRLVRKLESYSIDYIVNQKDIWCSFGFPDSPRHIKEEACAAHMKACSPIFHGYNDKRVFFCHVSWSAEKCGKFKLQAKDYIDLEQIHNIKERHIIARHCYGVVDDGYISFCRLCGGCGSDNNELVIAGEQI